MSTDTKPLSWALDEFSECYSAFKLQSSLANFSLDQIKQDLKEILVVPGRSEKSRKTLADGESGKPVLLPGGQEVVLNAAFISAASTLAFELELDELYTAELMFRALDTSFLKGADPVEAGTLLFFQRYQYILNILGYLVAERKLHAVFGKDCEKQVFASILASYKKLYALLLMQNDLIDKQRATADVNNLQFVNKICYAKRQLFDLHDLLSQILCTLVDSYAESLSNFDTYSTLTTHINTYIKSDEDIFILHYIPALARIVTSLVDSPEDQVKKFHGSFTQDLKADYAKASSGDGLDLSKSTLRSYARVVYLMFFITFIPWCKQSPQRTSQFDFEKDILKQVEWLISYGTLEQLLCYCSESMRPETKTLIEQGKLLEFRLLLQRSHSSMSAVQLLPKGAAELMHAAKQHPQATNLVSLLDVLCYKLSSTLCDDLLAPYFHTFFSSFINHAAIVLTQLRDSEEDFLLSSSNKKEIESVSAASKSELSQYAEDFNKSHRANTLAQTSMLTRTANLDIDLDELATCAELERFYMACVYTYSYRPELCELFWNSDDQNVMGFITWGLENNTSPLITATFCLLLGSLTYGCSDASVKVWDLLVHSQDGSFKKNDYSKISIDSILNSLSYYVDSLTESLESELIVFAKRQQEKLEHMYSGDNQTSSNSSLSTVQLSDDSVAFISGFFMLLSTLIENSGTDDQVGKTMRESAFSRVLPTITSYLRLDNLISAARSSLAEKKLKFKFFDEENRTILLNLNFNLLTSFAKFESLKINCEIWNLVDKWLCHSLQEGSNSSNSQPTETTRYAGVSIPINSSGPTKNELAKVRNLNVGINMKEAFRIAFHNISEISNFVKLLQRLLFTSTLNDKPVLPYPTDLGAAYRHKKQIGIWPYIEFLIAEVFEKSTDLPVVEARLSIQSDVLSIIENSLTAIDWDLYEELAPKVFPNAAPQNPFALGLSVNGTEVSLSYHNFIRLHHSLAILNYLFDIGACRALFKIINIGDEINTNDETGLLVAKALSCVDKILGVQSTFIRKLLPVLQNMDGTHSQSANPMGYGTSMSLMLSTNSKLYENVYYPPNLGTKGLSDFFDVMLINITSVVQVAMYVGSASQDIVKPALSILNKLATAPVFNRSSNISNDNLLLNNRLLSIFEGIDESDRLKFSFLQQVESSNTSLETKLDILSFIHARLVGAKTMTIGHFLLGFVSKAGNLFLDPAEKEVGLFHGLVDLLRSAIDHTSMVNNSTNAQQIISYGPAKLTCLILKIIVELCRNPITSRSALPYLREFDLLEKFLASQIRIDEYTIWDTKRFDGDIQENYSNAFVQDPLARETFLSYIESQNLILQYFSFEVHNNKSIARRERYMNLLLNGTEFFNGTPKILEFLDISSFQLYNIEDFKLKEFEKNYNLGALVQELCQDEELGKMRIDVLERVSKFVSQATFKVSYGEQGAPATMSKEIVLVDAVAEAQKVSKSLVQVILALEIKALHSRSLHSWAQLIQVLTKEGLRDKGALILQVLQIVLPKINNDYYERDILFAEELISLCLFLCDIYEKEACEVAHGNDHGLHRLLPLLKTCFKGLASSNSTVNLRSNIYLILNKFLQAGIKSAEMIKQISACMSSTTNKMVDVICNDCVHSEGVLRISSIICLESLVHLLNMEKSQGILNILVKNNSISLLARSLKRADEIISDCGDSNNKSINNNSGAGAAHKNNAYKPNANGTQNPYIYSAQKLDQIPTENGNGNHNSTVAVAKSCRKSGISIDTLLYELTALKTTLYLLIRIGQTKAGASQLVQNEIFPIIRRLQFLAVDVDLGMEFYIEGADGGIDNAAIRLSLDVPITLRDINYRRNIVGGYDGNEAIWEGDDQNISGKNGSANRGATNSGKSVSYYELLVPVFQLVATILVSGGPSYRPGVGQAEQLLQQFRPLVQAIMKRDAIMATIGQSANGVATGSPEFASEGLPEMVNLFTLIHSVLASSEQ